MRSKQPSQEQTGLLEEEKATAEKNSRWLHGELVPSPPPPLTSVVPTDRAPHELINSDKPPPLQIVFEDEGGSYIETLIYNSVMRTASRSAKNTLLRTRLEMNLNHDLNVRHLDNREEATYFRPSMETGPA
ncbi:hypothetical protein Bpfe_013252 [Biomphalaria pfeifferi]|uniref:Uncharacterized protein n=1 Tax=Biomphalaria pfeifferi TaxID=112525 RepID=A0AAD8BMT0_BIOPF|nr:hypothetical protein Bpfe_013252 [Biomphalaria pfeifferi]